MAKLLFYRQKRVDEGVRTGLEVGEYELAWRFDPGPGESNPILLWFVDIKCEGPGIPDGPEQAQEWFENHGQMLRRGLRSYAQEIKTGTDIGFHSTTWNAEPQTSEDVQVTISCSASNRVSARQMASILEDMADQWDEILDALEWEEQAER